MRLIESEVMHRKAMDSLKKVKAFDSQRVGYKFVKIDERTKVFRKII